jgi:hypothetical protein
VKFPVMPLVLLSFRAMNLSHCHSVIYSVSRRFHLLLVCWCVRKNRKIHLQLRTENGEREHFTRATENLLFTDFFLFLTIFFIFYSFLDFSIKETTAAAEKKNKSTIARSEIE